MTDEVIPYGRVAWERIIGRKHPLDVILDRQMHAYLKVDQSKYFVRITEARASSTVVMTADRKEVLLRQPGAILPTDNILLLRLTDPQVDEIRATGFCAINAFTAGGLSRRYRHKLKLGELSGPLQHEEERQARLFTPIDFGECLLFERGQSMKGASTELHDRFAADLEHHPVQVEVREQDLFVSQSDLDLLWKSGISSWQAVDYPFQILSSSLPIYWAYQASMALNRDAVPMPDGVLGWLQDNAPRDAWAIRGIRTLSSMVRMNYRHRADFDRVSLDMFPNARELPAEHLSKPLRLLMDISDWWADHWTYDEYDRFDLWRKLVAAGFRATAVPSLFGAISGKLASRETLEHFKYRHERDSG